MVRETSRPGESRDDEDFASDHRGCGDDRIEAKIDYESRFLLVSVLSLSVASTKRIRQRCTGAPGFQNTHIIHKVFDGSDGTREQENLYDQRYEGSGSLPSTIVKDQRRLKIRIQDMCKVNGGLSFRLQDGLSWGLTEGYIRAIFSQTGRYCRTVLTVVG